MEKNINNLETGENETTDLVENEKNKEQESKFLNLSANENMGRFLVAFSLKIFL